MNAGNRDPAVPTLKQVVGHEPGDAITTPEQIGRYLEALAKAAPDRTRLVQYATTWEGRPLHYLVVGSRERIARLDDMRKGMQALASGAADADRLDRRTAGGRLAHPWRPRQRDLVVGCRARGGVSPARRARATPTSTLTLRDALVIIDPMQNPDGRQRFVDQQPARPRGRARSEPALSRTRRAVARRPLEPLPVRHESRLFRAVAARDAGARQGDARVVSAGGRRPARDGRQLDVLLRPAGEPDQPADHRGAAEVARRCSAAPTPPSSIGAASAISSAKSYDAFYPGYGESWPIFHGAIGMTYEQASARGLAFRREDGTTADLQAGRDAPFHRRDHDGRDGRAEPGAAAARLSRVPAQRDRRWVSKGTREYLIPAGQGSGRGRTRLARLLARQGIQVKRAEEAFQAGHAQMPRGTFIVPLAQPAGRLARNLLDPDIKMDDAFLKEQDRRRKERLPDQIYDVTAWSLPLMFDVEVVAADTASTTVKSCATSSRLEARPVRHRRRPDRRIGFLHAVGIRRRGRRGRSAARTASGFSPPTRLSRTAGRRVSESAPRSSGCRATRRAPPRRFTEIAQRHGAELVPISETWTEEGISLGSGQVAAEGAASAAGVGRAGVEPVSRLGALRARAAVRSARHGDARRDAAELRHAGLRRPRAAVRHLQLQRRCAAAAEGLDPQRRNADHDRRGVALGGARSRRAALHRHAASRRHARSATPKLALRAGRRASGAGAEAGPRSRSTTTRRFSRSASGRRTSPARCCA